MGVDGAHPAFKALAALYAFVLVDGGDFLEPAEARADVDRPYGAVGQAKLTPCALFLVNSHKIPLYHISVSYYS